MTAPSKSAAVRKPLESAGTETTFARQAPGSPALSFDKAGRYQILDTLGSGGMGVVYKALDLRLGRFVAIKRLNTDKAGLDPEHLEAFLREARVLAQLRHFNLPEIYDIDSDDKGPFITMEFIAGSTLMQQHKNAAGGRLDSRYVLECGEQVCAALEAAHKAGVVHRDIKPSNILTTSDGVPKLIDFGIAVAGKDAAGRSLTTDTTVAGTRSYSSPEQRRNASEADHRSDIYSMGATLYALLTGENPLNFKAEKLVGPLRPMLVRAMSAEPAQRFQSAAEFRRALREVLDRPAGKTLSDETTKSGPVAADDRPLLERLRDEVAGHMDAGRFQEAVGVWQRIGKLTKDEASVARHVERCRNRIRAREVGRLLENISRLTAAGKLDEAEVVLRELRQTDPNAPEGQVWLETLRDKRVEAVKKLYFDAKQFLHEGQIDAAAENSSKALAMNRDLDLAPRLETLAAVCRTRFELAASAANLKRGDREQARAHAEAAARFLEKATALPPSDPLHEMVRKALADAPSGRSAVSDNLLPWLTLTAAAPGLAVGLVGALLFGARGLALGAGLLVVLAVPAAALCVLTTRGLQLGPINGILDDLRERQNDNGLITKVSIGAVVGMLVIVGLLAALAGSGK
jgi:serine/threonine protein kinase